jgi:hypothetical protein
MVEFSLLYSNFTLSMMWCMLGEQQVVINLNHLLNVLDDNEYWLN